MSCTTFNFPLAKEVSQNEHEIMAQPNDIIREVKQESYFVG